MILIVNRSKKLAASISQIFYHMGILSHATTPAEALSEISPLYRAVLVIEPDTLPDPQDFVKRVRSYAANVPIFSISDDGPKNIHAHLFDQSYKMAIFSSILVYRMAEYCKKHRLPYIGDYRLAGINACCDMKCVEYFDEDMQISKTEAMVLRYLIRSYPNCQSAEKILKYAYKQTSYPQISSVKTCICVLNKKFHSMEQRELIFMSRGEGYQILTPEYIAAGKGERSERCRNR